MRPEDALHIAVVETAALAIKPEVFWFHVPNQSRGNVAWYSKMKRMGLRAGVPDLVFVHCGIAHFVELKAGDNTLSPPQREARAGILRAGARHAVCRSVEDCQKVWKLWELTR